MNFIGNVQITLCILKPHLVAAPHALRAVKFKLRKSGFKTIFSRKCLLSEKDAKLMYGEHQQKFFYNRLVTFMTSGLVEILVLERNDAILGLRKLLGPTKVYKTQFTDPYSIRGVYGLSDTRNAIHGSDSIESVVSEIGVFFPNLRLEDWLQ